MNSTLQRAWQLYRFRRYSLALEETVKFLGQHPESAEAHCLLALIHGKEKRQKQAMEAAEKAIQYMPDWSYPHFVHALINYWFNKYQPALKSLSEALRIQPDDPDFYEIVSAIHADQGHFKTALQMAEKGLEFNAQHVGCLSRRGHSLFHLNHHADAEAVFRTVLNINPEHPEAQGYVGHYLVIAGKQKEALQLLRNALLDNPRWALAKEAWSESIRSQYRWYGAVANLRNLLFARHEATTWLVGCAASIGLCILVLMQYAGERGVLFCLTMSIICGIVFGCMFIAMVNLAFFSYLSLVSKVVLYRNRELRRTFSLKEFFFAKRSSDELGNFVAVVIFLLIAILAIFFVYQRFR